MQGDHYKVIREIGAASTVLLKNTNDTLPLNVDKIKRAYFVPIPSSRVVPSLTSIFLLAGLLIVGSDAGPNPDGPNGCSEYVY